MRRSLDFRGRLVALATALTVATLGGAFTAVHFVIRREEQRRFDDSLVTAAQSEVTHLGSLRDEALAFHGGPNPVVGDVRLQKWAVLYDADGHVLLATDNWRGASPSLGATGASAGKAVDAQTPAGEPLRVIVVPVERPEGARLLLGASRRELDGDAVLLARAMGVVFAVAVAWAAAVSTWLVRRLTRGHVAIARVARRVAKGDLRARVGELPTDPETAQLARNVDAVIDRMGELLEAQGRFIAHAAHELRSPLTGLLGELSNGLRRPRQEGEYRRVLEEALASARSLRDLTEDLLALARVDAATHPTPADEVIQVGDMMADAIAAHAARADVEVQIDAADAGAARVRGRRRDLARMLRNLVDNGVRHTPAGGTVDVAARLAEGQAVEVTVTDAGRGVPEAERARIFDAFYRGAAERAGDEGTGLGLAIVRTIARAHGGEVGVSGRADGESGAVFRVRLPLARG